MGSKHNNRGVEHKAISVDEVRAFDNRRLFFKLKENRINLRMIYFHAFGFSLKRKEIVKMLVVTEVNTGNILDEIDRRLEGSYMKAGTVNGRCRFRMGRE